MRTAVVTGASAGVGRATAVALGRRGWKVALLARGREGLEEARREVEAAGGSGLVIPVDVADADAVFGAADRVVAEWGGLDLWINNAMVTIFAPIEKIAPEEYRRVTEVTYLGQVYGTMAALRHMRRVDRGTILQVGSALAYRSIPLQSAYCGAKAATRGFIDSIRSELIHDGSRIRLTMVHLPAVDTPQFDWARARIGSKPRPVAPVFIPEAVAEEVVRAAYEAPRELWIGGPTAKAILGTMAAPMLLDRMMADKAYTGQMSGEPVSAGRKDNLFEPVPEKAAMRGRFGSEASSEVGSVHPIVLRIGIAAAGVALSAGAALLARRWISGPSDRRRRVVEVQPG
jgi:NAD(P)-dependent dehydrogenase (short-subunit alcohol dehydrogenase family)